MGLDAGADGEWLLFWTARDRPVPCRRVPVLAGWADLDQREADAGITARHPILIDPQYRIDPLLARFLTASRFTWLAEGTREAYAKDYRLFFSFLWQRGKYWHEADPDDLLDWEAWRRRSPAGLRISGSKWQRELAALRLLYEWAEKKGHIARSPVLVHAVRLRDGSTAMAADQAPRDVRCSDVKWVTPRTYRLWLQVGLSRPATVYGRTCLLITRQWLPKVPGIPAATAAAAARRIPDGPAPREAAYTREEFEQIKAAAARTFRAALTRIRASREHLRRWHDGEFPQPGLREQYRQTRPGTGDYLTGEALDVLLRTGDVPLTASADRQVLARHARALGGVGPEHTWARLFLTMPEAAALAVLLVCDQGWNRSVLEAMTVPDDMPGAGEDGLDIYGCRSSSAAARPAPGTPP